MKLVNCPFCGSDDVGYEISEKLDTPITQGYRFKIWICTFLCRLCQTHFTIELDDEDRKEYV